ncbi:MAG: MFS transporter [Pseudomonadota bacterium]
MARSPFSNYAFRWIFLGHLTSLLGASVTTIGLALLALRAAPEQPSVVLGTALAIKMVTYICVAPLSPRLSARWARRQWLIVLDLVRALVVAVLPLLTTISEFYLAIGLLSAASALFTPVYQSLLPMIITEDELYLRALSWSQMASSTGQLAGPLIAAALLLSFSFEILFWANALTFLFSAFCILRAVPTTDARPSIEAQRPWWGFSAYLRTPRLRAMGCAYIGIALTSATLIVNTAPYIATLLDASESVYAIAISCAGLGTIAGAAAAPRLAHRMRLLLACAGFLMTTGLAAAGSLPEVPLLLTLWTLLGFGLGLAQTPAGTLIKRSSSADDRDAYFAAHFALTHGCWLAAYLFVGYLVTYVGWSPSFLITSVLTGVAGGLCWLLYPVPDPQMLTHRHGDQEHTHEFVIDAQHPRWPHPTSGRPTTL